MHEREKGITLRKLGIIGGTSWNSTAMYYEHINRGVAQRLGGLHSALLAIESLEMASYAAMQRVVREVADRGVAVCVVEHNVAFVRDLCDAGIFMFSGAIMARGSVAELIRDPQLTELYFGH